MSYKNKCNEFLNKSEEKKTDKKAKYEYPNTYIKLQFSLFY